MNTPIKPPCTNSVNNKPEIKAPKVNLGNIDCHMMILVVQEPKSESFIKIAKSDLRTEAEEEFYRLGIELKQKVRNGLLHNADFFMFTTNRITADYIIYRVNSFETYDTATEIMHTFSRKMKDIIAYPINR